MKKKTSFHERFDTRHADGKQDPGRRRDIKAAADEFRASSSVRPAIDRFMKDTAHNLAVDLFSSMTERRRHEHWPSMYQIVLEKRNVKKAHVAYSCALRV